MKNITSSIGVALSEFNSEWSSDRLAVLFAENKEMNTECKVRHALQFKFGTIIPKPETMVDNSLVETWKKYTIVHPDDIMVNGLNLNYDFITSRIGLVKEDGIITSAYISLRPREGVNSKFYNYYFKALDARKVFHGIGTGIRRTLSYKELKNVILPIPTNEEQSQIVRYLDWKVSGINQLVATKRKQIKVLQEQEKRVISDSVLHGLHNEPLKDSNNRWIGKIPVSWKMIKLGKFCSFQNGISESGDFFTSGTPFVGYGDVYRHLELPEEVHGVAKSNAQQQEVFSVKEGDIFFTRTSENIEEVGMAAVCKHTLVKAVFSGFVIRCRPRTAIVDTDYMKYYLQIPAIRNHFSSMMNIVIRASLGQNLLKQMPVVIPPIDEQRKIAEYLDIEHAKYLYLISTIQKEIDALQELKTCLISDVVTGKIDVRDIEIPEYEFVDEEAYSESDGDEKSDESDAQED